MNTTATPTTAALRHWLYARRWTIALLSFCGLGLASMSTCSPKLGALSEVQTLGVVRVATINSPTTYYVGASGPAGFEYDLARGFADFLGVELQMVVADNASDALRMVREGKAHLAAASLVVSEEREKLVRFTQPVMTVVPELVYVMGQPKPKNLGDLHGRLRVQRGSVHAEMLRKLKSTIYPDLQWEETEDQETEELLYQVANEQLAYTIANSDIVAMHQRYYPRLREAFALAESQNLAWALPPGRDKSLLDSARAFLRSIGGREMARLRDRYYGHIEQVDYVGAVTLATHVQSRLPPLRKAFEEAAAKFDLDWRLLAAMGYQESHWNKDAISPTGVRGIMMLTLDTANILNVANREDPVQSIFGGAKYFRQMVDQIPEEVTEPERSWMALAAYNMGVGHLLDARWLTKRTGGDAKRWLDVRNSLPLLTQSKWYSQLKYGYARGYEAVTYVGNVRTYYDMLVWISSGTPGAPKAEPEPPLQVPHLQPEEKNPLKINSPVL